MTFHADAIPRRRLKTAAFGAVWALFLLLLMEALSLGVIAVLIRLGREEVRRTSDVYREQSQKIRELLEPAPRLLQLDPLLGWRYRAGHRDGQNQMNAQGLRSAREYSALPRPGVIRVAAFGDSFVYCNEVADRDSWPAALEDMFPAVEVLNYGVGGYGTDQALQRYLAEGARLSPDVVVIGFAPVDLARTVNVYRRFLSNRELPLAKPRFVLEADGRLRLLPSPLREPSDYERCLREPARIRELGRHDQWYRATVYENALFDRSATVRVFVALASKVYERYLDADRLFAGGVFNRSSTAFRIQTALFQKFAQAVEGSGAVPLVVILPDRESIVAGGRGRPRACDPLVQELRRNRIAALDLTDSFVEAGRGADVDAWFMSGGHYSPLGNRHVASTLGRFITESVTSTRGRWSNGWRYLRRTSSKDADIVIDAAAPFSPPEVLRIIFTPDMSPDSEPTVHWISLPGPRELYHAAEPARAEQYMYLDHTSVAAVDGARASGRVLG